MRRRPTYASVAATLALVLALSGGAYAATVLPRNSVGTPQLKKGAVTTPKIRGGAVTKAKLAPALGSAPFASRNAEPFREVGAAGEPPFENGWGNHGFDFSTAGFYKDSEGLVHLKGTLSGDSVANGVTAFTLPAGYRPAQRLFLPIAGGGPVTANLQVLTSGAVVPTCAIAACVAGLDGLVFRVGGVSIAHTGQAAGSGGDVNAP